jgi:hypothetical protein
MNLSFKNVTEVLPTSWQLSSTCLPHTQNTHYQRLIDTQDSTYQYMSKIKIRKPIKSKL